MSPNFGADNTSTIDSGPFGDADAHGADLDELHFVTFQGGGLSTRENDRRARILVGRKGSGKTLYLRRLRRSAADDLSLFALERESAPPGTKEAMLVFEIADSMDTLKETWPLIWRRAILISVSSYVLFDRRLEKRGALTTPDFVSNRAELGELVARLGFRNRVPIEVCETVTVIVSEHGHRGRLDQFLKRQDWQDLEFRLSEALQSLPPFCLYLDNLDETFQLAPKFWLAAHEGLMHCVLALHAHSRFANKLHVHITIRESVYSSALRTPQLTRMIQDTSIRHLAWNASSTLHFLNEKVRSLPREFTFLRSSGEPPVSVENWLGIDLVDNARRGIQERLDQYILRHTRLLPRDVVIIGNTLAHRIKFLQSLGIKKLPMEDLRSIVSSCACNFAKEQMQICAEYVVSHMVPQGAVRGSYSEYYTAETTVQQWADDLKDLVSQFKKDRIQRTSLHSTVGAFAAEAGIEPNVVLNSLWWSGLVGHCDNRDRDERHIFFTDENLIRHEFDRQFELYVLHPALLDFVPHLTSEGDLPVTPV